MASNASYIGIADIKQYWLDNIAPKYFELDNTNNYNIGIFGYANEIMANTTEDAFNATAIARREFYPVTAQFTSSLYTMATLQSLGVPVAAPARCKCALLIPQDEIIQNSTFNNGVYECTIDNCLKLFVGDLQFMLDYPIKIISRKTDKWQHTAHYDVTIKNSLNTTPEARYISNTVAPLNGRNYVMLFIMCIRQLEMQEIDSVVNRDSILDTTTMNFEFTGKLANFEVFYKENSTSEEVQLAKVLVNAATPSTPYVQYKIVNNNKIQLLFQYNTVFVPKYNSEIICRIYTTQGSDGNFDSFSDDVVCSSDSEKYPYNSTMTILGRINGSAIGGKDALSISDFRNEVIMSYATNNTITTSNDLQLYFDKIARDISNVKVLFRKIRDDPLIRLFGAYIVFKDSADNVIPTNTLDIEFFKSNFADLTNSGPRITIPAGTIFEYKEGSNHTVVPALNEDGSLLSIVDLKDKNDGIMRFTNPFLLCVNIEPNNSGYYASSLEKYCSIEYTYVNDGSAMQFIGGSFSVTRNAVVGSNYYKFMFEIVPTSTIPTDTMFTMNEEEIRAEFNGKVIKDELYHDDTINQNYVRYTIEYDTDDPDKKFKYIQASNTVPINGTSQTGYKMKFNVGDRFIANDILATKRISDLGTTVLIGDINGTLYPANSYFTFSLQDYDDINQRYIFEAYLSTTDEIDLSGKFVIANGIYESTGAERVKLAIPMDDAQIEINVLHNNDGANIANKYTTYAGLNNFTLTNTYVTSENDPIRLMGNYPFIRSNVEFYPGGEGEGNFKIKVSECPLIGAAWAIENNQYKEFMKRYSDINTLLRNAYYALENNFTIDSKFYNTYGKARFFTVGNDLENMEPLDSVQCSFRFGVSINTIASTEQFINRFRKFVQEYMESTTTLTASGQDLYMMNLIAALKSEFEEMDYIEYYGMNSYDHFAQKVLGPDLTTFNDRFIPEFLNLKILTDANGAQYPDISVSIID